MDFIGILDKKAADRSTTSILSTLTNGKSGVLQVIYRGTIKQTAFKPPLKKFQNEYVGYKGSEAYIWRVQ